MKRFTWCFSLVLTVSAISLMSLSGCGKSDDDEGGGGRSGRPPRGKPGGGGTAKTAPKVNGYATSLKGRVVYNGGGDPESLVKMEKPTKDQDACPATVPMQGWYVKNSKDKKGVQYALVYLKPPSGMVMPEIDKKYLELPQKDGKPVDVVTIQQPHCQFEPRVISLFPGQKIEFINDSNSEGRKGIAHDSKVTNSRNSFTQTMPPGGKVVWDLEASDSEPNQVSCGIHQSTMSAYVWKMTHAYAVVTDAEGNFELKNVPVTEPKLNLYVWHEMLDPKSKDIGPVEAEVGKEASVKDIAIPK
jgi:hypothetical protein